MYRYIYICLSNDCSCFQSHHFFSEIWNVCRSGSMGTALNPFLWVWLYQTKKHLRIGRRLIRRQEILHHCVKTQKQGTIFLMSSTKLVEDSKYESIYLSIYIFIQMKENQYLKVAFGFTKNASDMQVFGRQMVMYSSVFGPIKNWKPHYPNSFGAGKSGKQCSY